MVNVICMKWGTKYGPEYVNVLRRMVARNLKRPHRFVCFTEHTEGLDAEVEVRPLPECRVPNRPEVEAWRKISLFRPDLADLKGPTLFLDLDIVITGSLDPFFDHPGTFCIIHNWTHLDRRVGNSSVFRFEAGAHPEVFEEYNRDPDAITQQHRNEQIYVSDRIDKSVGLTWWPAPWCISYQKHCQARGLRRIFVEPQRPGTEHIVVFHGLPNPPEASRQWFFLKKGWKPKLMRPASWIAGFWK